MLFLLSQVGICGRTGSGKSSLSLAFFNMVDVFEGKSPFNPLLWFTENYSAQMYVKLAPGETK